jgi:hypothetical protein
MVLFTIKTHMFTIATYIEIENKLYKVIEKKMSVSYQKIELINNKSLEKVPSLS